MVTSSPMLGQMFRVCLEFRQQNVAELVLTMMVVPASTALVLEEVLITTVEEMEQQGQQGEATAQIVNRVLLFGGAIVLALVLVL